MADTEKPTVTVTPDKATIPEVDLTKYKVSQAAIYDPLTKKSTVLQTAAEIVHQVAKKIIELSVEGAKVIDLCIEGDKLIEQGTGAVYNKNVKGVKVLKGALPFMF